MSGWSEILGEAPRAFVGDGKFTIRAYSEFMPAPYVFVKPYESDREPLVGDGRAFDVSEYEEAHELAPGLQRIARHVIEQLVKLTRGTCRELSKTLLRDNPAWPASLATGARALALEPFTIVLPLALSRTQDDKGRVRWTLFGASHEGPERAFWRGLDGEADFARLVAWAIGAPESALKDLRAAGVRVLERGESDPAWACELPDFARAIALDESEPIDRVRALVTFRPFDRLPQAVQRAYLDGALRLIPCPSSLLFFEHRSYRKLAAAMPHVLQVPLLHLFPRSESSYGIRIPQSGWLDEQKKDDESEPVAGHRVVRSFKRTHRWQRVERHTASDEGAYDDHITVALFSTEPDHLGLYGKPMAKNAQVWTESYERLLDGPRAGRAEIAAAANAVRAGGRFGYRFFYPPMRAAERSIFWHRPLVARIDPVARDVVLFDRAPLGHLTAERDGVAPIELRPRVLDRDGHREAAMLFDHDPGHMRLTTAANVRKILEWSELLGAPLAPSLARRLLHVGKETTLEAWLGGLAARAFDHQKGAHLVERLRALIGSVPPPELEASSLTFDVTRTREFEESLWRTIASLAEGDFRAKANADGVVVNAGRTGGAKADVVKRGKNGDRDLERLGDHLHAEYARLVEKHGMSGRAFSADQVFRWETDFDFPWSLGWTRNQTGEARERNIFFVIPGRDRGEAVIMGDHYDTAYMEDVYDPSRGGDRLRAASAGADDNHSATAALLRAADVLLPLAREGKLARDVWLVHLTGEEFPADCLGARSLAQRLVERNLALERGGERIDLARARVRGAFILDMVAHNNDRDRDVFQIAPGEGRGSARLAWRAHLANERWNRSVPAWNKQYRAGSGRGKRVESGSVVPEIAEHVPLIGEVRPEWEPRSALYNTDGQIFSDVGIPVVLFMENYDIRREGYHDTHDTMANIDLDYGAALIAIAIETVAECASASEI